MSENTPENNGSTPALQPDLQQPAPNAACGPVAVCQKCGAQAPVGTTNCPTCGAFVPSNEANLRHGLRRYQTTGVLPPDLKTDIDSFRANVISDQGGLDELPAIRAGLIRLLVDCEVGKRLLMQEVIRRGIDSRPGKAAYASLLATMDKYLRIAVTLGIERRQRDLSVLSPADWIRSQEAPQASSPAAGEAIGAAPDREVLPDRSEP